MDGVAAFNAFFLIGSVMVVFIVLWAVPVRLWIEALSAGVKVGIGMLVGMRLRKVSPPAVVRPLINATKAGLDLDIDALEAHYLAGGRVDRAGAGDNAARHRYCATGHRHDAAEFPGTRARGQGIGPGGGGRGGWGSL